MAVLTITSDIGEHDFLVSAIKGQLLRHIKDANIIDVTHQLSPFNFPQAAYVCRNAIKNFAPGSFHIALINLFDEKPEHILIAEHNGQFIACPDNGLITMILEEVPQKVVAVPFDKTAPKNTLYCAAVIGKAFAALIQGQKLEDIGDASISIAVKNPLKPLLGNNWIEGQIIFVDNFENVIVNITREEFEEQRRGRSFKIVFRRDEIIDKISESYADVSEGEKLALFNSANYLEIAINKGNASSLLGLHGFNEKQSQTVNTFTNKGLFYQTVKVFFEE